MIKNDSNSIDANTIMTKMKDEVFFTVADLFDPRDSKDISYLEMSMDDSISMLPGGLSGPKVEYSAFI